MPHRTSMCMYTRILSRSRALNFVHVIVVVHCSSLNIVKWSDRARVCSHSRSQAIATGVVSAVSAFSPALIPINRFLASSFCCVHRKHDMLCCASSVHAYVHVVLHSVSQASRRAGSSDFLSAIECRDLGVRLDDGLRDIVAANPHAGQRDDARQCDVHLVSERAEEECNAHCKTP